LQLTKSQEDSMSRKGPLEGLKILDFTTLLPGPYATLALADMGADVLRIEAPHRPDLVRQLPPFDGYSSAAHSYINRNKRSLGLDLKHPGAVELVKELVQDYDIVVEQFRPGVMARLGIGYDELSATNPRLIFCSITGYGQTGTYRDRAGHDINYLALAGISSYTGTNAVGPIPAGFQIADVAGGSLHAVVAILAAVVERLRSGNGQAIDISMTDAAFALNAIIGAGSLASGADPGFETHALNGGGFYGYYRTSDGRYMSVGSLEPQFVAALCDTLVIEPPKAVAFALSGKELVRFKNALRERFAAMTFEECCKLFEGADACVEPVLTINEAAGHEQLKARDMVADVPTPDGKSQRQMASPLRFSSHAPEYRTIGRKPGEDNRQVLRELGKSDAEIDQIMEAGILG